MGGKTYSEQVGRNPDETQGDGSFWMSLEDYMTSVEDTAVNYNTEGWGYGYFLNLDDKGTGATYSNWRWNDFHKWGYQHELIVTSEVDQDAFITVWTWDKRSQHKRCKDSQLTHAVQFGELNASTRYLFRDGSPKQRKVKLHAGENKMRVAMDMSNPYKPRDWSVVAWGPKGDVAVKHAEGVPSDHFPHITRKDTQQPSQIEYGPGKERAYDKTTSGICYSGPLFDNDACVKALGEWYLEEKAAICGCDSIYSCFNAYVRKCDR